MAAASEHMGTTYWTPARSFRGQARDQDQEFQGDDRTFFAHTHFEKIPPFSFPTPPLPPPHRKERL